MAKNEKTPVAADKVKYTFGELIDDILISADCSDDEAQDAEIARRERLSKRIVVQMLIDLANYFNDDSHQEGEKLRNAIDVRVKGDSFLSAYIFYVTQNPQFDYSWNYLRKKENSYEDFLFEGILFLRNMLVDINMLAGKPRDMQNMHIVFNDIFDVFLTPEKPFVKTNMLWENFHRLATVKRNYHLTVKCKECILVTGTRKIATDAEKLIDTALDMLGSNGNELK